tara:strand:- start:539 stop:1117 length:579 start_codon:yes stop_codon:yes gene_type:complete
MVVELGHKTKDFIRVYDGMVKEPFCQTVIQAFDKSKSQYIDREQRPTFHELNVSQRYEAKDSRWITIQNKLTNIFIDAVELYMKELDVDLDFPYEYAFEEHRIKKYDNNGKDQFKDHVDVGDYNSARRFLVCFLYLNNVTAGGETKFPKIHHAIEPKCGRILLFPATWQYRHSGEPPITEPKYIVGSYLHYL